MKSDEKIVEKYLKSIGFIDIKYEPDGNIPPDFVVPGDIAIEATRLNQFHEINGELKPLDDISYSLTDRVVSLCKSYEGCGHTRSAFLSFYFSRPLSKRSMGHIISEIKNILDANIHKLDQQHEYKISEQFKIKLTPAAKMYESAYKLGSPNDMDSGGYVVSEIYKSLNVILKKKTETIAPYRNKYNKWWLALVDYIGLGLNEHELKQLMEPPSPTHDFDKVLLIAPLNVEYTVEI